MNFSEYWEIRKQFPELKLPTLSKERIREMDKNRFKETLIKLQNSFEDIYNDNNID